MAEIHYSRIYRKFRYWLEHKCLANVFKHIVFKLKKHNLLDTSVLHGDGTSTAAKKGGDNLGFNGYKHMKGDKVVAICGRNCNVISAAVAAPGNRNESILLPAAMKSLKKATKAAGIDLAGKYMSLDGAYDSRFNRKLIFNQ